MLTVPDRFELGHQLVPPASCEVPRTSGAAEGASARRNRSVPVGTRKAGVEHNLENLGAERLSHLMVPSMKSFAPPEEGTLRSEFGDVVHAHPILSSFGIHCNENTTKLRERSRPNLLIKASISAPDRLAKPYMKCYIKTA
jgi:hypothetical protein